MADKQQSRRYTTAELEEMERSAASEKWSSPENLSKPPKEVPPVEFGKQMLGGAEASLKRTYLGLKQLATYMTGDDPARQAVNDEIKRMEEEYGPVLETTGGRVGEFAGTVGQFMVPGAVASKAGKAFPAAAKVVQKVVGTPGSPLRSAVNFATYEAAQPVQPGDLGTDSYVLPKAGRIATGAAVGGAVGKITNMLTSPGPTVAPERGAVVKEANRLGIKLTPAQRTGDVTLAQYEEGLASRPGSAKIILDAREAQNAILSKKAAEALGRAEAAPNEAVLFAARESAAKGYEPLASIDKMSWDTQFITDLDKFIKTQARKATGSTDAAAVASRLKKGTGKWTGSDFLEDLQGIRDMSFGARQKGDVATAKQLSDLDEILEEFASRRVEKLAKLGKVAADAVDRMKNARVEYAKIHAIERATEPVSGKVSPLKYLSHEFKRKPASRGPGSSPVDEGLRDVGAVARVLKQVTPYIGSSGTAERIAGQQLVEASQGPLAAFRAAGPIAKNYLAAKYYMKYGGQPGLFGSRLTPGQNAMVRRMLPPMAVGGQEALTD